jgi:hypothetical protein
VNARNAVHLAQVGTELLVRPVVRSLGEEVEVEIREEEIGHRFQITERAVRLETSRIVRHLQLLAIGSP